MSEAQSFSVCRLSSTSFLVPPILVLYAPSLTLSSWKMWFYSSMPMPSSILSTWNVLQIYVLSTHFSRLRSSFISCNSCVSKWAAHCSLLCVPLPLIGWQSSPISLRIQKPRLASVGSILKTLQRVWQRKCTPSIWLENRLRKHWDIISHLLDWQI